MAVTSWGDLWSWETAWGVFVWKGGGIMESKEIDRACKILNRWFKKHELKEILVYYRRSVRRFLRAKKKMENPVHYRTGKPLKESTLYQLKCDYNRERVRCGAEKLLIQLFVIDGVFGSPGSTLRQRLESYFDELLSRYGWEFEYLQKKYSELKENNPGSSYKTREERLDEREKKIIKHYKFLTACAEKQAEKLEKEHQDLLQQVAFLESTTSKKQIRNKRKNDLGLNVIDGGREFESKPPPFTPVNPS
jgi:hypothetical protein